MILRHLATTIRRQDWFPVLIELAVVVVGILIALQVDNWNQARKDRAREQVYLERLARDIARDRATLEDAVARIGGWAGYVDDLFAIMDDPALAAKDPCGFVRMIGEAAFTYYPVLSRHTFHEITSSGNLDLIRDDALKDTLGRYYDAFDAGGQYMDAFRQINLQYGLAVRAAVPIEVRRADTLDHAAPCSLAPEMALVIQQNYLDQGVVEWLPMLRARHQTVIRNLNAVLAQNADLAKRLPPTARTEP
jgi:hypothetical protein